MSRVVNGRSSLLRWTPQTVLLLIVAAGLWWATLQRAAGMSGPGTMGMSLPAFAGMWALMMSAMMLPSVAPVAALHARTVQRRRGVRLTVFSATYLGLWAVTGVPAWMILRLVEAWTASGVSGVALASLVLLTVGVWQLTPLKERCLRHCRSPLGQLLRYADFRGPFRDVRVASHHALYCLGCCWGLMALFIVTGTMHVGAMVVLTVIVAAEKLLRHGQAVATATGVLALVAAVAVWWIPDLARGLVS